MDITFDVGIMEIEEMFIILDDDVLEDVKRFSLQIQAISGPFPVTVMNSTAIVSIQDNDCKNLSQLMSCKRTDHS